MATARQPYQTIQRKEHHLSHPIREAVRLLNVEKNVLQHTIDMLEALEVQPETETTTTLHTNGQVKVDGRRATWTPERRAKMQKAYRRRRALRAKQA